MFGTGSTNRGYQKSRAMVKKAENNVVLASKYDLCGMCHKKTIDRQKFQCVNKECLTNQERKLSDRKQAPPKEILKYDSSDNENLVDLDEEQGKFKPINQSKIDDRVEDLVDMTEDLVEMGSVLPGKFQVRQSTFRM